jgi:hypothetical protein
MTIEAEQTQEKNRLVRLIESNKTVKTASALVGVGGLFEIALKADQLSSDSLTKVVAITALAFVNSAIFQVMENAEKVK